MELHIDKEFAAFWPELSDEAEAKLLANLQKDGCTDPIILWANHDDTILDGYHRYKLCRKNDIPFKTKAITLKDRDAALQWIFDRQLGRRNITDSQRAYSAAVLVNSHVGKPNTATVAELTTVAGAAEKAGVSERLVTYAARVQESGAKELKEAVRDGEIPAATAAVIAELPKAEQKRIVDKGPEAAKAKAKEVKAKKAGQYKDEFDPKKFVPRDAFEFAVPEYVADAFSKNDRWQAAMNAVSQARKVLTEIETHCSVARLDIAETERLLAQARTNLKFAVPYTECVKCRRKPKKDCQHCKGLGWLNKATFTACASDADKAWLEARG